jgi:hypothetical protein
LLLFTERCIEHSSKSTPAKPEAVARLFLRGVRYVGGQGHRNCLLTMTTSLTTLLLSRSRIKNPVNVPFLFAFEKTLRSSIVSFRYVIQRRSIGVIGTYARLGLADELESN